MSGGVLQEETERRGAGLLPPWLKPLLETTFFSNCRFHGEPTNMYCLGCCMTDALCSSCLASHPGHHFIQIRRSSYHDVVRVNEIPKAVDISGIQTYVINSAKVIFLNERPQMRPSKSLANACRICDRSLLDSFSYCSLGCKIAAISDNRYLKQSPPSLDRDAGDLLSGDRKEQPPPGSRREKRRKGTPRRAPMGCC
ncbi:protein RGF1 INDUCIBLE TRANSCRIPTION FACTOR 1-like [Nymphaea colorata]|nr:protein RGF1 INDUCIBLE TRANSCRIPTION FACTOR 1-like [Nymphaea colorata]